MDFFSQHFQTAFKYNVCNWFWLNTIQPVAQTNFNRFQSTILDIGKSNRVPFVTQRTYLIAHNKAGTHFFDSNYNVIAMFCFLLLLSMHTECSYTRNNIVNVCPNFIYAILTSNAMEIFCTRTNQMPKLLSTASSTFSPTTKKCHTEEMCHRVAREYRVCACWAKCGWRGWQEWCRPRYMRNNNNNQCNAQNAHCSI